jgi:hypothetical protein
MPRKSQAEKVHDRVSRDLPINSRVAIAIVSDPYSATGEKISVVRSIKDDPLADMYSRSIIDTAQFAAGRCWQKYHEITQIGPIAAIDPAKEAVDGGRMRDPITDKQIDAFREIMKADKVLGATGSQLVRDFLAHGMTVGQMYDKYDCKTGRRQTFLSIRVRECLDDLGKLWGLVG